MLGRFFSHGNKHLSVVLSSEEIHANICFPGVQSWSTPATNQHIFIIANSTSWRAILSRCSFQPAVTKGAGTQSDPQHGESRNPDLEKCWSKTEGTMSLCLRANSLFSLATVRKYWTASPEELKGNTVIFLKVYFLIKHLFDKIRHETSRTLAADVIFIIFYKWITIRNILPTNLAQA